MARLGVKGGRLALFGLAEQRPEAPDEPQVLSGGVRRQLLPLGLELLSQAGVSAGDAFALVLDNDKTSAACMLAAMELRCVCAVVGASRAALLGLVCRQTGISKVLTVDDRKGSVSISSVEVEPSDGKSSWMDDAAVKEGGGCVCMLTSGSVGEPKVVPCTWEHMRLQGEATQAQLFPDRPARIVCGTSIAHAFSINTIFTLWSSPFDEQSELCFAHSTQALYSLLKQETPDRTTVLYSTPGTYTALAEMSAAPLHVDVPYCAGTRLSMELFETMRSKFGLCLMQNYGSTEMGDIAAWGLKGRSFEDDFAELKNGQFKGIPHVGALWDGVRIVVDENQQVCVSTPWQCLGYVKQRELHHFDANAHPTADIGSLKPSSESSSSLVWLQGRLRPKVNLEWEGENFELSPNEIEHVLLDHPRVSDALVLMQPVNETGTVRVRVVVVSENESSDINNENITPLPPTEAELSKWCEQHGLPAVGRALRVAFVPFLPCSPAGKLMYT